MHTEPFPRILLGALTALLLVIPWTLLLVSESLLFPFVNSKALPFRLLVEIALMVWVPLALAGIIHLNRARSTLAIAIFGLILWIFISNQFGLDPTRSFWSTYERADGGVQFIHYIAWYLMLATTLTNKRKWLWQGASILAVILVIALLAIFSDQPDKRVSGVLGNPIYFGNLMVFGLLLGGFLYSQVKPTVAIKTFALLATLLLGWGVIASGSRGSAFALVVAGISIVMAWFLTSLRSKTQKLLFSLSGLAIVSIITLSIISQRDTIHAWAKTNNFNLLARISRISLQDQTTADRLANWSIAIDAFKDRPLLGWGQEHYSSAFLEHYHAGVLDEAKIWFDRAHNAYLDWLVSNGSIGLLLYLAVLGIAFWRIWQADTWQRREKTWLSAILIAYLVKNITGFDVISSYLVLFFLLALLTARPFRTTTTTNLAKPRLKFWLPGILLISAAVSGLGINRFVNNPAQSNHALWRSIQFQKITSGQTLPNCRSDENTAILQAYCQAWREHDYRRDKKHEPAYQQAKKAFELAPQYVSEQFHMLTRNLSILADQTNPKSARQHFFLLRNLAEKSVRDNPRDWRTHFLTAALWSDIGEPTKAIALMEKILAKVNQKTVFWVTLSKMQLRNKKPKAALAAYRKAEGLNPNYSQLAALKDKLPFPSLKK